MVEVMKQEKVCLVSMAKIWSLKIPSKIHVFSWRLLLDGLPIICQLIRHGIIDGLHKYVCPFYFIHDEDIIHLFLECVVSFLVWGGVCWWISILIVESCLSLVEQKGDFCSWIETRFKDPLFSFFWFAACWILWLSRNFILFQGGLLCNWNFMLRIKLLTSEWYQVKLFNSNIVSWDGWKVNPR